MQSKYKKNFIGGVTSSLPEGHFEFFFIYSLILTVETSMSLWKHVPNKNCLKQEEENET
jgi:hypothetical protein